VVGLFVEGEPPKPTSNGGVRVFVTPHYFEALSIPLLAGRDFTDRDDENAPLTVVINESMARFYFGTPAAAIGRLVHFAWKDKGPTEVIGVIKDYVRGTPRNTAEEFNTYFSYRHPEALNRGAQSRLRIMMVAMKTSSDPLAIASAARQELHAIDPLIPILRINTVEQQLDDVLAQDWMIAELSGVFGALAIVLVSLGLFGLVSYRVALRITEIGVRLALGATRGGVLGMILRESLTLIGAGMAVGLIAALALTTVVAARLYGVSSMDPRTIAGAAAVLIAVGALAAFVPARRAASVDPMVSLRCE
jgi:ABC-type antimicrobial peptide transport system permease subunit